MQCSFVDSIRLLADLVVCTQSESTGPGIVTILLCILFGSSASLVHNLATRYGFYVRRQIRCVRSDGMLAPENFEAPSMDKTFPIFGENSSLLGCHATLTSIGFDRYRRSMVVVCATFYEVEQLVEYNQGRRVVIFFLKTKNRKKRKRRRRRREYEKSLRQRQKKEV